MRLEKRLSPQAGAFGYSGRAYMLGRGSGPPKLLVQLEHEKDQLPATEQATATATATETATAREPDLAIVTATASQMPLP